eukprot:6189903-Pleurochrysis_carterae.AAC.3
MFVCLPTYPSYPFAYLPSYLSFDRPGRLLVAIPKPVLQPPHTCSATSALCTTAAFALRAVAMPASFATTRAENSVWLRVQTLCVGVRACVCVDVRGLVCVRVRERVFARARACVRARIYA